jgi:hypothetical protein
MLSLRFLVETSIGARFFVLFCGMEKISLNFFLCISYILYIFVENLNRNTMGHRINERNTGHWSLDSEPKHVRTKPKKVSRSFTESEIEIFNYFMNKIADNVKLDASDLDNQVYRDNGDILIQFSRDRIEDVRSLLTKFEK